MTTYSKTNKTLIQELISEHEAEIKRHQEAIWNLKENNVISDMRDIEKKVISDICEIYGIGKFEVIGKSRKKELMQPRREVVKELRDKYGYTLQRIGKILGNRHHGSIMYLYNS